MNASQVGRLVARERGIAGFTQAELAERLGTTQAAVSKIETGRTLAGLDMLDRIARALGRPITLTLGADPRPSRVPHGEAALRRCSAASSSIRGNAGRPRRKPRA